MPIDDAEPTKRVTIDQVKVSLVAERILASRQAMHGTEKDLVRQFKELFESACRSAGVVSLSMPPMSVIMATREAVLKVYEEEVNGCAQES